MLLVLQSVSDQQACSLPITETLYTTEGIFWTCKSAIYVQNLLKFSPYKFCIAW